VSCELHIAVLQDNVTPSFLHPVYEVRPSRRRDDILQRPDRRPEPASHSPLSRVEYFLRSGRISPPPIFPRPVVTPTSKPLVRLVGVVGPRDARLCWGNDCRE
jgi:hypothetical protein